MQTSSTWTRPPGKLAGLTLIELLVALAIIGLIASVSAPALARVVDKARFDAAVRSIANELKHTRLLALSSQNETVFVLDVDALRYGIAEAARAVNGPSGTSVSVVTAESERIDPSTAGVRFFPDGSATGGRVTVSYGQRETQIVIDWLTGRIEWIR